MKKIHNMGKWSIWMCMAGLLSVASSCAKLDLNPPSAASSENWFSSPEEVRLSLNDFYRSTFFVIESNWMLDRNTDDWSQRTNIYTIAAGSLNASSTSNPNIKTVWSYTYKNISRANRILEALDNLEGKYPSTELNKLRGEARFFRAYAYTRLITLWGDVPYYLTPITPEEAFEMGRTDKSVILKQIYEDYDYAANNLPVENNNSGTTRVDQGAAYAFKARCALYQHDYETAAAAAKLCMDMEHYDLAPDYGELFRDKTRSNKEVIFSIPHSNELELGEDGQPVTQSIGSFITRSAGGTHNAQPSWELLAVYEMTNGKTIDEPDSGFDPHDPFADRDPRCLETFAAPGSRIYNIEWNPSPNVLEVMDYAQNRMVTNKDSKGGSDATNCAYNACCLRKGAQESWRTTLYNDNPLILMRYADVLLMYAEAKIELGEIDATVLACINDVRARLTVRPVRRLTPIPPSPRPIRRPCAKCSAVNVGWNLPGRICATSICSAGISSRMLSDTTCTVSPVRPVWPRSILRPATGFGPRLRSLTKRDSRASKRWPTERISFSTANESLMKKSICGLCPVMTF